MPIKKRSVIKAFTRVPMVASCAFCFAKFTPLFLFSDACFEFLSVKFARYQLNLCSFTFAAANLRSVFYASPLWCAKFRARFRVSAACAVLSSRSCSAHKRRFVCHPIIHLLGESLRNSLFLFVFGCVLICDNQ